MQQDNYQKNEEIVGDSFDVERVEVVKGGIQGHEYKQRGPYLICHSCQLEHALFIGTSKIFKGYDEYGMPMFSEVE